jgi:ABC-type Na+ efflux pump permease subunit
MEKRQVQLNKILELMKKDWAEAFRSKQVLFSTTFIPLFVSLGLPIIIILSNFYNTSAGNVDPVFELIMNTLPPLTSDWAVLSAEVQIMVLAAIIGEVFLLFVPMMIGSILSVDTIIGEKERATIEGLLALPMSDSELLVGKIGTTLLPVMGFTWILSSLYAMIIDFLTLPYLNYLLLPDIRFTLLMLALTPLFGFIIVTMVVMVSSRVSSAKDAQQLTSIFIIPAILLIGVQFVIVLIDVRLILIGIIILGIIAFITFRMALTVFDREKLLIST